MRTVAVTGGIGSGKSTVCAFLAGHGIPVYDTDSAAKGLYAKEESLLDAIEEAFGCGIRLRDGSLDRAKLSSIVFPSPERLKMLESIVHPAVLIDFKRWNAMQSSRFDGSQNLGLFFGNPPFCVMESAIILDKPAFMSVVSKIVLVDAPLAVRLERACVRDGASQERVIQRMSTQHFDISKVDAIIHNDGTLAQLKVETEKTFSRLKI